MADWTAPFHMPKFTNSEYREAKSKYVAKNGYTITIPALSDIFKFGNPAPMTDKERTDWRRGNFEDFSMKRLSELEVDKQHKKDLMMQMLASPTPEVFAQLGAVLTAVDDAQDAISTLGAIARLSRKIAPKALAKLITGPLGLLLTVNDILNLVTGVGQAVTFAGFAKRTKDGFTASNPWSGKAKLKRWRKLRKWKPTFADVIQAAQTTDQIFGIGVSLGPIVGLAQDLFHGAIRSSVGMKVTIKFSPHSVPEWIKTSYSAIKSIPLMLYLPWNSPDETILMCMQAQAMAQEAIMPYQQSWNPLDTVNNLEAAEIRCPIPSHPTTLWAMKDMGINIQDVIGWPGINKTWASPDEITEYYAPRITSGLKRFVERHNHDSMGVLACSIAADSAPYQLANFVGEADVEVDYTVASKLASALLLTKTIPLPEAEQDSEALALVIAFVDEHEEMNRPISSKEFKQYALSVGYKFYPAA